MHRGGGVKYALKSKKEIAYTVAKGLGQSYSQEVVLGVDSRFSAKSRLQNGIRYHRRVAVADTGTALGLIDMYALQAAGQ
jgi:hypothetical protein